MLNAYCIFEFILVFGSFLKEVILFLSLVTDLLPSLNQLLAQSFLTYISLE